MLAVLKSLKQTSTPLSTVARWLFLTGLFVSVIQFVTVLRAQSAQSRAEMTATSVDRATRLRNATEEIEEVLAAFAAFFASSRLVEEREFALFASRLGWQAPGIRNVGWAPRLAPDLRPEYELGSERFPGRPILWFAGPGEFQPAGIGETYFPLSLLAAPGAGMPIGFDLYSEPKRRHALERAMTQQAVAISAPIESASLSTSLPARHSLALYPVYTTQPEGLLKGFVVGVVDLSALLEDVVADGRDHGQDLYLVEADSQARPQRLIHSVAASQRQTLAEPLVLAQIEQQAEDRVHYSAAGSHWQLYALNSVSPLALALDPASRSALLLFALFSIGAGAAEMATRLYQRVKAQRQLDSRLIRRLRQFDPVTNLPNRDSLLAQITQQQGKPACILIVNLRRFRRVVEALNYADGDKVLLEVADRIKRVTPPGHFLARLGGDEFALLAVGDDADPEHLNRLAARIRNSIVRVVEVADKEFRLDSVVAGAMVTGAQSSRGADILSRAALAMRVAKSKGQSSSVVFDSDTAAVLVRRQRAIESALDLAIRDQQIEVRFQPQFKSGDLSLHGFEALLRWEQEGQIVPPPDIVYLAQEGGRLQALDELILDQAIEFARQWRRLDPQASGKVSVNMPADHFCQNDFVTRLMRRLKQSGVDPGSLGIELTESALIEDIDRASATIQELRDAGIEIALDDFGTGFSSLSHLRQLQVQWLKLEQQFVQGLCDQQGDAAIVSATIDLARSIKAGVIAEGVEQQSQLDKLRELGCDAVQGFLFSRAAPVEQALRFINGFPPKKEPGQ